MSDHGKRNGSSTPITPSERGHPARNPKPEVDLNRRNFLGWLLGWTASTAALVTGSAGLFRFLLPNVSYEPSSLLYLEQPEAYTQGVTHLKDHRIFLLRKGQEFRALSGRCTHLGCAVGKADSGKGFHCPCHGSRFDSEGKVLNGPAPESLPWLAMERAPDGRLMVDRSRAVSSAEVLKV